MLRLHGPSPDLLFDALLPDEAKVLPGELAKLDALLSDPKLLVAFAQHWAQAGAEEHRAVVELGRPTTPMATYLRVMVLKHRTGFGYETLMRSVADSLHLRRFCQIPLSAAVPDESTIRKLTRRIGPDLVDEMVRSVIEAAIVDKGFRPRAMRVDSTVAGADIRYPTDIGLAADAVRVLARAGRRVVAAVPKVTARVRDRSRAVGRRMRALTRSLKRRSGEAKADVQRLTEASAAQVKASIREADKVLAQAKRSRSRAVSPKARAKAMAALAEVIGLARRVVDQTAKRFAGEKITNRLVSLFDPDARPIRRGKLGKPNEFGYMVQMAEVTANTRRGARGILFLSNSKPGPPMRTRCSPPPSPSSNTSGSHSKKPPSTPGSAAKPPKASSVASRCSSPGPLTTPAPGEPAAGWPATGLEPKAASRTSSASTGPDDQGSKANKEPGSGKAGPAGLNLDTVAAMEPPTTNRRRPPTQETTGAT